MTWRLTVAMAVMAGLLCPLCAAQTDDTPVRDAAAALIKAFNERDNEAFGALLSDSGFVGCVDEDDGPQIMDKEALLQGLEESPPGFTMELQDIEVSMQWIVATLRGSIVVAGAPPDMNMVMDLMLMREAGEWKVVALAVTGVSDEETEPEIAKQIEESVGALPQSLKDGDIGILDDAISEDAFVMAFIDPSFEVRWVNSQAALKQMIESVIPMITVSDSRFETEKTTVGEGVAIIDGTWVLDITDMGETRSEIRGYGVKTDDGWKIVAIAGGPEG